MDLLADGLLRGRAAVAAFERTAVPMGRKSGPGDQAIASSAEFLAAIHLRRAIRRGTNRRRLTARQFPKVRGTPSLTRVAGQLRRAGLSEAEMLAALRGVNERRCHPPLDDEEVAQIARNVAQYPARRRASRRRTKNRASPAGRGVRRRPNGSATKRTAISGRGPARIGPSSPRRSCKKKIMTFANSKVPVGQVGEDAGQRGLRALADHASARRRPAAFRIGAAERRQRSQIASCGFTTTEPSKRGRTILPPACGTS